MERDSFVFYRSFHEAIMKLADEDRLIAYDRLMEYAINWNDIGSEWLSDLIFWLMKPNIDANNKKALDWKTWGRPRKKPVVIEKKTSGYENEKPNEDVNENVNVNEEEDIIINNNNPDGWIVLSNPDHIESSWEILIKTPTPTPSSWIEVYWNQDIDRIIEMMKAGCEEAKLQYMPWYKERFAAKRLAGKKFAKDIEKYNMWLEEFIKNIILLSAKPFMKKVNTPNDFYYNRWHILNANIIEFNSKKEKERPVYVVNSKVE